MTGYRFFVGQVMEVECLLAVEIQLASSAPPEGLDSLISHRFHGSGRCWSLRMSQSLMPLQERLFAFRMIQAENLQLLNAFLIIFTAVQPFQIELISE